jgi:phosphohistidine phosphatase
MPTGGAIALFAAPLLTAAWGWRGLWLALSALAIAGATGAQVEEEPALAAGASSAQELLALARSRGEGVALVGHNPEVAEAVTAVARRHVGVSAGTIAAVDADAAGQLRLAWLKAPGRG